MSILNDDSLKRIKLENDQPKQTYGRPVRLISDLLETISLLKKEKNKWQNIAKKRKEMMMEIQDISMKCLSRTEPEDNESDRNMGRDG